MVLLEMKIFRVTLTVFNPRRPMKKLFYLAAILLAAAACMREPVIPEEPDVNPNGPIEVTLVAGNPSTRTELGYENDQLKPFWSNGDNITVFRVPNEDEDFEYEWDHLFTGDVTDNRAASASFTGSVSSEGQYRAVYPEMSNYNWNWYLDSDWDDDVKISQICFNLPSIQEPSPTSFDPQADLLVSAPFSIDSEGDYLLGSENNAIPINFTRPNAIVKIKLNPTGSLRNRLDGQKVRKVVFGEYSEWGGGEVSKVVPQTRADYLDNDGNYHALTGRMYYNFPYVSDLDAFDVNVDDKYLPGDQYYYALAQYSDETAYDITSDDGEIATYLIVAPSILKNTEVWAYNEDMGDWAPTGELNGLHIQVETERFIIDRVIKLPSNGIALQPSVVTTLNITLDENNKDTSVHEKQITFKESDITVFPSSLSPFCWEELVLTSSDFEFNYDDLEDAEWTFSYDGIAVVNTEYAEFGYEWVYDEETNTETKVYCVSGLYVVGESIGETTLTVNYNGYTASCNIHVIDFDNEIAQPIDFEDPVVESICASAWGGSIVADKITYYEASKVTSLINDSDYNSYFRGNTEIERFNELKYFTGLTSIEYNAFDGCSNLQTIELPNSVTSINEYYAFRNCESLTRVILSESLGNLGEGAFQGCTSLTEIALPASLRYISAAAFKDCYNLKTVIIPSDSQLESLYGYSDYYSGEIRGSFTNCYSLESIWLPPTLKTIGQYAFYGCSYLSEVILSEGLRTIEYYAFSGCNSLYEIVFPSTLKEIKTGAFENVYFGYGNGLKGITFLGTTPPDVSSTLQGYHWDSNDSYWYEGVTIFVPVGTKEAYEANDYITNYGQNTIAVGFKTVGDYGDTNGAGDSFENLVYDNDF